MGIVTESTRSLEGTGHRATPEVWIVETLHCLFRDCHGSECMQSVSCILASFPLRFTPLFVGSVVFKRKLIKLFPKEHGDEARDPRVLTEVSLLES